MSDPPERRINPWSVWALVAIMLGGVLVFLSYRKTLLEQMDDPRPPRIRPVTSLTAADHHGREVDLFTQGDHLFVVGYFYTGQLEDAKSVCDRLAAIHAPFASDPRLRLVGVSMSPDLDTQEVMRSFAETNGYTGDEWIFLSGPRERLRTYMNKRFRYPGQPVAEADRKDPKELHKPEPRLSLVDHQGVIRGIYWQAKAAGELSNDRKSAEHIQFLLDEIDGQPAAEEGTK